MNTKLSKNWHNVSMMEKISYFIDPKKLSGLLLIGFTALALLIANSSFFINISLYPIYREFLSTPLIIAVGDFGINKPILLWINDGLMAIFFFLLGLEIKRELLVGELATFKKALLPTIAAIGGIVIPGVIYTMLNFGDAYLMRGWAIPVATDIAFALGIMALIGKGVPKELKILLLSIAIIDDIAAILIIAIFYTSKLSLISLGLASIALVIALIINFRGVTSKAPYVLLGIFMWVCVLKSGVHATLAGVIIALCIPIKDKQGGSPVKELEDGLFPWVFFMIMPIFAFANAGVNITGMTLDTLANTKPLGVILGLFIGKQLGVFSFIWLSTKMKIVEKPKGVTWAQIYGLALLTGIGFTMSLFIGALAYSDPESMAQIRLSVLIASALSAVAGFLVLKYCAALKAKKDLTQAQGQA